MSQLQQEGSFVGGVLGDTNSLTVHGMFVELSGSAAKITIVYTCSGGTSKEWLFGFFCKDQIYCLYGKCSSLVSVCSDF